MLNIRKFLFKTGERMMTWAFLLGLLVPALADKFGLLKKIRNGNDEGITVVFLLGGIGFLLLLPITAPLLGFGWFLVRVSGLDSAKD